MSYINGEKVALSSNLNIIGGNRDKFRKFIDGSITKLTAEDLNEVSSIGDYAFMWYENLTSLTIPSNITRIGDYAFSECRNLISVIIEEGVTYIGDYVFSGVVNSNQIKSITYPSTVTELGIMTFVKLRQFQNVFFSFVTLSGILTSVTNSLFRYKLCA